LLWDRHKNAKIERYGPGRGFGAAACHSPPHDGVRWGPVRCRPSRSPRGSDVVAHEGLGHAGGRVRTLDLDAVPDESLDPAGHIADLDHLAALLPTGTGARYRTLFDPVFMAIRTPPTL